MTATNTTTTTSNTTITADGDQGPTTRTVGVYVTLHADDLLDPTVHVITERAAEIYWGEPGGPKVTILGADLDHLQDVVDAMAAAIAAARHDSPRPLSSREDGK